MFCDKDLFLSISVVIDPEIHIISDSSKLKLSDRLFVGDRSVFIIRHDLLTCHFLRLKRIKGCLLFFNNINLPPIYKRNVKMLNQLFTRLEILNFNILW